MKAPYGIHIQNSCITCTVRADRLFCNLPDEALETFDEMKFTAVYPKGAILFVEGQDPLGVFVVCSGKVKLFATSYEGKTLITQIADVGEVLGMSAVVAGKPHDTTAETLEPCELKFLKRDDFLRFLKSNGEVSLRVAQLLSTSCQCAHEQARAIGLSHSVQEKLARFLLERCEKEGERVDQGIRLRIGLTHEEIAQMIGSSRETVTRLLSQLRKNQIIQVWGATLLVRDPDALRSIAHR